MLFSVWSNASGNPWVPFSSGVFLGNTSPFLDPLFSHSILLHPSDAFWANSISSHGVSLHHHPGKSLYLFLARPYLLFFFFQFCRVAFKEKVYKNFLRPLVLVIYCSVVNCSKTEWLKTIINIYYFAVFVARNLEAA